MGKTLQLAVFELDGRRYGVPLERVERVLQAADATPLPQVPANIAGVIDLHGALVPVFNIRRRLGGESRGIGLDDQFLVVHTAKRTMALIVDRVNNVMTCEAEVVVPAEAILPGWNEIQGVVQLKDGLILIQDLDRFLSLQEDRALEEALEKRGRNEG